MLYLGQTISGLGLVFAPPTPWGIILRTGAVGQSTDSSLRFFPSALPMLLIARNVANLAIGLQISVVCGFLVAIAAGSAPLVSAGSNNAIINPGKNNRIDAKSPRRQTGAGFPLTRSEGWG